MTVYVEPSNRPKIEDAFWRFHTEHPEVYDELVRLARMMKRRGDRFGIATIYEVARWRLSIPGRSRVKLNNNFRALYARLIMQKEPDLDGIFNTRKLGVASHLGP